jgi:phospholipase/carboxylesterase
MNNYIYSFMIIFNQIKNFYLFLLRRLAVGYSLGVNIASCLLLLHPRILTAAILFHPMVPLMPENGPNLTTKNIFMAVGDQDPIVPRKQTEMNFYLFKKAESNVFLRWRKIQVIN